MTPGELSSAIVAAVRGAVRDGELAVAVPDSAPLRAYRGGYATPLPMRLAGEQPAERIAHTIAKRLAATPGVVRTTVTGPGFLNIETTPPRIDETYGVREVPHASWPEWPRTFANPGFTVRYAYAYARAAATARYAAQLANAIKAAAPDAAAPGPVAPEMSATGTGVAEETALPVAALPVAPSVALPVTALPVAAQETVLPVAPSVVAPLPVAPVAVAPSVAVQETVPSVAALPVTAQETVPHVAPPVVAPLLAAPVAVAPSAAVQETVPSVAAQETVPSVVALPVVAQETAPSVAPSVVAPIPVGPVVVAPSVAVQEAAPLPVALPVAVQEAVPLGVVSVVGVSRVGGVVGNDGGEGRLRGLLGDFPGWAVRASVVGEAGVLMRQLVRIAEAYHEVYEGCPALPVGDAPVTMVHVERLRLAADVRVVLGNGLRMIGETPRERI